MFTPTDNTIMTAELAIYETFIEAGIPHYTGADSFALNGAFLGYGVDYANLGVETANMVADILLNGDRPRHHPGADLRQRHRHHQHRDLRGAGPGLRRPWPRPSPRCAPRSQSITTAESFDDLNK